MSVKNIRIESVITVFDQLNELPEPIIRLMQEAKKAREKAYAPYSDFQVGAAILLDNGEVITGSNQENASYPSGLCAERTALYYAGAKFPNAKMISMGITAASNNQNTESPIPPCGACRQAIAEYEIKQDHPIEIYFMGEKGQVFKSDSLSNLLPLVFDRTAL